MDLALNRPQRLICFKTQPTNCLFKEYSASTLEEYKENNFTLVTT